MKKCRKIAGVLVVVMIAVLTMVACGSDTQDVEPADKRSSAGFEDFEGELLGGGVVTEDIFAKADLTMVNVWATYCGPCIDEMPDLGKISKEYQDKGFQIVGIVSDTYDAEDATAKEIVEETGADYSHIVLNTDLMNGPLKDVQVVPTTFFVDKNGNQVGQVITGSKSESNWKKIIDDLLRQI